MSDDTSQLAPMEEQITQEKINLYAELSGDFNPLHVDLEVAAASEFGGTIAHGPICLQPGLRSIASWLGEEALPPGATVAVTYRHPVRPGDRVSFQVTELQREEHGGTRVEGQCVNQDGTPVASLTATLPGSTD